MTHHLIKMRDDAGEPWYFFWSSTSERPAGAAMTWEGVWAWSGRLVGSAGERSVELIARADRRGTSHPKRQSARETIEPCNRAGKGDTWLTAAQQLELAIQWRDDPDYEIEGVAQDMVCFMCSKPIASEADRTWVGMPPDPMCGACRVKVQDAPAGKLEVTVTTTGLFCAEMTVEPSFEAVLGAGADLWESDGEVDAFLAERGEGAGGLGPALELLQMLTERHPPREGKAHNLRLSSDGGLLIEVWTEGAGFWPLAFSEADLQLSPAAVLAQIEEAIAPGLRVRARIDTDSATEVVVQKQTPERFEEHRRLKAQVTPDTAVEVLLDKVGSWLIVDTPAGSVIVIKGERAQALADWVRSSLQRERS